MGAGRRQPSFPKTSTEMVEKTLLADCRYPDCRQNIARMRRRENLRPQVLVATALARANWTNRKTPQPSRTRTLDFELVHSRTRWSNESQSSGGRGSRVQRTSKFREACCSLLFCLPTLKKRCSERWQVVTAQLQPGTMLCGQLAPMAWSASPASPRT